jgi:hypothetical protein
MFTKLADTTKAAIFSVLTLVTALVAASLIAPASAFAQGEASRAEAAAPKATKVSVEA